MKTFKRSPRERRTDRAAGFSLVEMSISLAIFGVIGYGLTGAVQMGQASQAAVASMVATSGDLRTVNTILLNELKLTSDDNITVAALPDGNDQLTFMHPIEIAGVLGWGVFDTQLGTTEAEQNRADWQLRYTVESIVEGGEVTRRLVRQIIDELDAIQDSEVIIEGLRAGTDNPRGFSVTRAGDMWNIAVSLVGTTPGSTGKGVEFHVKTRN